LTAASIGMGLNQAAALDRPNDKGLHGTVDLGVQVTPEFVGGSFKALAHFDTGKLDLSMYASAWAGYRDVGSRWKGDYGAEIGLRGRF